MSSRLTFFLVGLAVWSTGRQEPVFRARIDAVVATVAVHLRNRPVTGLTAADFQLLDNGVRQEISLATGEAAAVDVTLVLDASGSVSSDAFAKLKADIQAMVNLLKPDDRVRLLTFGSQVVDVAGVVPGGVSLPLHRLTPGGRTSFYNALSAALMLNPAADRPQIIVAVTDGFDNASFVNPREVVDVATYSSAALYIALLPSRVFTAISGSGGSSMGPMQGNRFGGALAARSDRLLVPVPAPHQKAMREAVTVTGGAFYTADARETLPVLFRRVLDDFRGNYILRYSPSGVTRGGWHEIAVAVPGRRDVTVRARKGYEGSR